MIVSRSKKRILFRTDLVILPFVIISALVFPSCKDEKPNTSSYTLPDSNVSYSRDIDPLFAQTCLGSQCHSGSAPAANLNLEPPSWGNMNFHIPQQFAPKDTNCLLLKWLNGTFVPRMPSNQNPLTSNQIGGIKEWIKEGAKNN
jgi:predicted CxxxxCH...CXXCH cytochrome family protein